YRGDMTLRRWRGGDAVLYRGAISPHTPQHSPATNPRGAVLSRREETAVEHRTAPRGQIAPHELGIDDIVPEALHRRGGWDIPHHFMSEKIVDRFGLQLPRDRELVRQLAVVYVLGGLKWPPAECGTP